MHVAGLCADREPKFNDFLPIPNDLEEYFAFPEYALHFCDVTMLGYTGYEIDRDP